jgi:hypothetical protein
MSTVMTTAAVRYRCFLRQKQPGAKTAGPDSALRAVMTLAVLAGSLPGLKA